MGQIPWALKKMQAKQGQKFGGQGGMPEKKVARRGSKLDAISPKESRSIISPQVATLAQGILKKNALLATWIHLQSR